VTTTPPSDLNGASVLVAGAGLAGLSAARDLVAAGAVVTIVDARDRVGGRVHTVRDVFSNAQHAESGGDMIDEGHTALCGLARDMGLPLTRILRDGFGLARQKPGQRPRMVTRSVASGWMQLSKALEPLTARYRLAERRWDTPIAADIARRSVTMWLDSIRAGEDLRSTAVGLRGFFLADPDELSLIALVDQFASDGPPGPGKMYRIQGGNDRLATALASGLGDRLRLKTELVAVSHRGTGVRASLRNGKQVAQMQVDYLVFALPATLVRRIPISPALPAPQHEAIASLRYGRATKTLVQFSDRFWRLRGRPRAFGSALPIGAFWEGNEDQRGREGILACLAGGSASDATRDITSRDGIQALVSELDWLGSADARVVAWHQAGWDADLWSRGGYAFFDPSFDAGSRDWLARPHGPMFFAGEHTSIKWQGYMNGAVESGQRAAAEIQATHRLTAK
jgi:monoamine oxidase